MSGPTLPPWNPHACSLHHLWTKGQCQEMNVDDVFPSDPLEPTVKYVASYQTPFAVPWAKGRTLLFGAGFDSRREQNDALFLQRSAFQDAARGTALQYRTCQYTLIKDESATGIANSSSNTTFAIGASVGGSFLGASGRGSYEKSVRDSRNVANITVRAQHTCGQIDAIQLPRLDGRAARMLRTSPDPVNEFRDTYGDFFVAGYRVGAVTSTTISGSLANKAFFEAKHAEIEVKIVFVKVKKSYHDVSQSRSDEGSLRVAIFDSIDDTFADYTALTEQQGVDAIIAARRNKQRAMDIARRAAETLRKRFDLETRCILDQHMVDRLCSDGFVTEVLLAPFSSLREYQSLLLSR